ncbi:MAG: hypothetical protein ACXVJD_05950 [Mucilaginibacter sp.]
MFDFTGKCNIRALSAGHGLVIMSGNIRGDTPLLLPFQSSRLRL